MNRVTDKNGKEIKVGDLIAYTNWLCTVSAITEDGIQIGLREFDNIILSIIIRDDQSKLEVLTEQEATIFLLKREPNDYF